MHHFSREDRDVIFKFFHKILKKGGFILIFTRPDFEYMPMNKLFIEDDRKINNTLDP